MNALRQRHDVVLALAQRRHLDRDDVQAVVEVLAELAGLHHRRQIAVGRGDQPDVDAQRPRAAEPLELVLLEHAQDLGLRARAHVADLVEEQRAAVGLLEPADALLVGAGERALLVAEQLGLEQVLLERRAVHLDEVARRCRSELWWMAPAISSLPVPVSPRISTVVLLFATFLTMSSTRCSAALEPTIRSKS